MKQNNWKTGQTGEEIATNHLVDKGYNIIEKNYRFSNFGEIDIICDTADGNLLVFVEVKTDKTGNFGNPALWVTKKKQRQLYKMAQIYLNSKRITDRDCRFDIIGVTIRGSNTQVEHYENAFIL